MTTTRWAYATFPQTNDPAFNEAVEAYLRRQVERWGGRVAIQEVDVDGEREVRYFAARWGDLEEWLPQGVRLHIYCQDEALAEEWRKAYGDAQPYPVHVA